MAPVEVATLGNAAVSAILAVALFYVWRLEPAERAAGFWSAALLFLAIRQVTILGVPVPPASFVATFTVTMAYVFWFAGARAFVGRPLTVPTIGAIAAALLAFSALAASQIAPRSLTLVPGVAAVAVLALLTGLTFLRPPAGERGESHRIIGILFCALAAFVALYPVYGESPASRGAYAIPAMALYVATAVGLIIATLRRQHRRSVSAREALEAANRRFQDIVDTASAWIWESDAERRITYISPQVSASLGIAPEAMIGRRLRDLPGVEVDLSVEDADRIWGSGGAFRDVRFWMTTAAGKRVHVALSGKPVHDAGGRLAGFRGITIDVTDATNLRALLETITRAVGPHVGPDYFRALAEHLCTALGAEFALVGRLEEGLRIRTLASFGDGTHQPEMIYPIPGTPCATTIGLGENLVEREAARLFPEDAILGELAIEGYAGTALRNAAGEVIGLLAVMSRTPFANPDMVLKVLATVAPRAGAELERQEAEARLRNREQLFRAILDHMPSGFHLKDAEGRYLVVNRALEEWYVRDKSMILDRLPGEIARRYPAMNLATANAEHDEVLRTGRSFVRERTITTEDGVSRRVIVCRFPVFDRSGAVVQVGALFTDITDLRDMEQQIRHGEARLQRIVSALDRSAKGIVVEDAQRRLLYVNRTAESLLGEAQSAAAVVEHAGLGAALTPGAVWSGDVIHPTPRGGDAILAINAACLDDGSVVTLLDDATERLQRERRQAEIERQLQEAQRMDAVGQLAGGIAHDFNNLIGAILGFSRFIAEDTPPESSVHGYAQRIVSASNRGRELIQQLLALARRDEAPRRKVSLTQIIEESAQLLRATLPASHRIEVRNRAPDAWVLANATQLAQIIVNLGLNAGDAMGSTAGTLTLALEDVAPDDVRVQRLAAAPAGSRPTVEPGAAPDGPRRCHVGALDATRSYVCLSVKDDGPGILAEVLPRIFDPFFTTKPRGKGTGLGLPVVQKLVLAYRGAIVVSTGRDGTTFDVLLPADSAPAQAESPGAAPAAAPPKASGRVLVVDDDIDFGDMVSTAMDRAGYEVAVCSSPREALEAFEESPGAWDVVITDQTMPDMSGLELIARLKARKPALRCILCTGYASSGLTEASARSKGADSFFHKPVDTGLLLAAVVTHLRELGKAALVQALR